MAFFFLGRKVLSRKNGAVGFQKYLKSILFFSSFFVIIQMDEDTFEQLLSSHTLLQELARKKVAIDAQTRSLPPLWALEEELRREGFKYESITTRSQRDLRHLPSLWRQKLARVRQRERRVRGVCHQGPFPTSISRPQQLSK